MDNTIFGAIIGVIVIGAALTGMIFLVILDEPKTDLDKSIELSQSIGVSEPMIEPSKVPEFENLGNDHAHAQIFVVIFGNTVDFSGQQYQLSSEYIHFENDEGSLIHRHATGVTLGFFFETMGASLSDDCFSYSEGTYCTSSEDTLEFYVNSIQTDSLDSYIVKQGDKIIISYGNDSVNFDDSLESI